MKIYTKRGDTGMTDLFGGERVKKSNSRVKAYGEIDFANTVIGLAHSVASDPFIKEQLVRLMKLLFAAGAEIATAPKEKAQELLDRHLKNRINETHIEALEQGIDEMETKLSPLKSFILPTGTVSAAHLHFARNVVRKAEIALIELVDAGEVIRPEMIKFINRLSDYLFVMARLANALSRVDEIEWSGKLTDDGGA